MAKSPQFWPLPTWIQTGGLQIKTFFSATPCPLLIITIFPKQHWASSADQPFQAVCCGRTTLQEFKGNCSHAVSEKAHGAKVPLQALGWM